MLVFQESVKNLFKQEAIAEDVKVTLSNEVLTISTECGKELLRIANIPITSSRMNKETKELLYEKVAEAVRVNKKQMNKVLDLLSNLNTSIEKREILTEDLGNIAKQKLQSTQYRDLEDSPSKILITRNGILTIEITLIYEMERKETATTLKFFNLNSRRDSYSTATFTAHYAENQKSVFSLELNGTLGEDSLKDLFSCQKTFTKLMKSEGYLYLAKQVLKADKETRQLKKSLNKESEYLESTCRLYN